MEEEIDPTTVVEAARRFLAQMDEQIEESRERLASFTPNRDSFAVHYALEQGHYMTLKALRAGFTDLQHQLASPL